MDDVSLTLTGYAFSVYTRVARLVLDVKRLPFRHVEHDPFTAAEGDGPHPFGRVPVLSHGRFRLYETAAIARYLDLAFPLPPLVPLTAEAAGRMQQVIGIVDSYGYPALVRQVFAQRVFRPLEGLPTDWQAVEQGLAASRTVLRALDGIAAEGLVLSGDRLSLADLHLLPMIDYFGLIAEGAAMLDSAPALCRWRAGIARHRVLEASRPDLSRIRRQTPP